MPQAGPYTRIAANGNYDLGDASGLSVGRFVLQLVAGGGLAGAVKAQARLNADVATPPTYLDAPALNKLTNAPIAAGASLPSNAIVEIESSGMALRLVASGFTGGGTDFLDVYVRPIAG